jgi:hypothetical protein
MDFKFVAIYYGFSFDFYGFMVTQSVCSTDFMGFLFFYAIFQLVRKNKVLGLHFASLRFFDKQEGVALRFAALF